VGLAKKALPDIAPELTCGVHM